MTKGYYSISSAITAVSASPWNMLPWGLDRAEAASYSCSFLYVKLPIVWINDSGSFGIVMSLTVLLLVSFEAVTDISWQSCE